MMDASQTGVSEEFYMFTTLIVQPIFNLLVFIYALLPGHNLGVSLIIFTVLIRLLMWPLVKKQLHHAKAMRELQPELKRIKKEAKGDRQKESMLVMALYKEREINPFASIGLLLLQLPILLALFSGLNTMINDPGTLQSVAYPFLRGLTEGVPFDGTLLGIADLTRSAIGQQGFYLPAFLIVLASAIVQYYQSKQLLPSDQETKSLKQILRDASAGKQADQAEVNAAVGRSTRFFIPAMVFLFSMNLPAALPLYWLTSGVVAVYQQRNILRADETELEKSIDVAERAKRAKEAEVVEKPSKRAKKSTGKKSKKHGKKRR